MEVGGEEVQATLLRPAGSVAHPAWIVLHGLTVPGRFHPVLQRFAQALASTGAAVLLPDVPAWRRLLLAPEATEATIRASIALLRERSDVRAERVNLVGFSFGATQGLVSATRPGIRDTVRAVVSFGGYCDLRRTIVCMMTGEHEWEGVWRRFDPDPYGRWIVAGNYLTAVPELAGMDAVAESALELAREAGRLGAYAAEPVYDPIKAELRERLPAEQREIWDLIAAPCGVRPPLEEARALANRIVDFALDANPGLDPRPALPHLDQRILLAHGFDDRLIPFTETLRLLSHIPARTRAVARITRLFAHSREAEPLGLLEYPREALRYYDLLRRALRPA
jgi:pimeloyl-ACP methyl ester carboxylesterase